MSTTSETKTTIDNLRKAFVSGVEWQSNKTGYNLNLDYTSNYAATIYPYPLRTVEWTWQGSKYVITPIIDRITQKASSRFSVQRDGTDIGKFDVPTLLYSYCAAEESFEIGRRIYSVVENPYL